MENNTNDTTIIKYKALFILSRLDKGWTVKKRKNKYIFVKKHGGKKEIFADEFLKRFMEENN
tara:strand:+ start:4024 stop:4209 length:186 start_codon:yes stop_codon:yes gene_type:complete